MSPFFDLDGPLSQNLFELPLPPLPLPLPTYGSRPIFSSEMPLDTPPVQAALQNALPSPPTTPGTPSTHRDPHYGGVVGPGLWSTGGERSPIVVRSVPPLRFTQYVSPKTPHLEATQPAPHLSSAMAFPPDWIRVPQRNYDHGRKQWNFKPLEPITFSTSGRPGVNLGDALRKKFADLDGRDDPMLQGAAGAISCRLLVGFASFPLGLQS